MWRWMDVELKGGCLEKEEVLPEKEIEGKVYNTWAQRK